MYADGMWIDRELKGFYPITHKTGSRRADLTREKPLDSALLQSK